MGIQVQQRSLFKTYWKLGYLLHLMTLAEISLIIAFFYWIEVGDWLAGDYFILKLVLVISLFVAPIYPQCDARSRFQNYKQVKDHLYLYGFQPRIIKPFSFSRCQRDAVLAAAEELGMEKQCRQYFKGLGYRWYHILPDFLFKNPGYLFQKAFWLNTFFAKHYPSKVDFSNLESTKILARSDQYIMASS